MNIRAKITLIFFTLVIFIVTAISASIYYSSAHFREEDFIRRLQNRAINTAKFLFEYQQIDATLLKKIERENPASLPNQFVKIYNMQYQELYSSDEAAVLPVDRTEIENVIHDSRTRFDKSNFEIIGFNYHENSGDYVIFAGATDIYGNNALKNLRNIIIMTFSISVIIVSATGYFYAGKVLAPISKIVREVESVTEESLDKRLEVHNSHDELGKLAATFNRMLARLQSAFVSQKNFIANASHELKTPFTVMAGEIEVTLLHPRDNEYYIRILSSVLQTIKRFNSLSTQLLLLAQTSSDNPVRHFRMLRIDDVLWDAKNEFEKYHNQYAISLEMDLDISHDNLQVFGDEELLKVLMGNMIDNGCKYSDNNELFINIAKGTEGFIFISFRNRGPGIEKSEIPNIFDPFYRGSGSATKKGFGVGLSLAEKIVRLHQGRIEVDSVPGKHTTFRVILPVGAS